MKKAILNDIITVYRKVHSFFKGRFMSIRGENSRSKILAVARTLFAKKGYSKVTMQDICNEAGISRGGLYRHYSSTEEIFAAIIKRDEEDALDFLASAVKSKISGKDMLLTFLSLRSNSYQNPDSCIDNAIIEFASNSISGMDLLRNRANTSVHIVKEMIELGRNDGSFSCTDSEGAAKLILWSLEGMGKHSALFCLTNEEINTFISEIEFFLT